MSNLGSWDESIELRPWQAEAFSKLLRHERDAFLAVACPGAGKTVFAARAIFHWLATNAADRVLVVAPSRNLKKQWMRALAGFGIQLNPEYEKDKILRSGFHGYAVTYQGIFEDEDRDNILDWAKRHRTLLVCDEIHHAGHEKAWGRQLIKIGDASVFKLGLSGTPFRSDKTAIPFVTYQDNSSIADFSYTYGDALRDSQPPAKPFIRSIVFPAVDGEFEWFDEAGDHSVTFEDELPEREARRRLSASMNMDGGWLKNVLGRANDRLTEIRQGFDETRAVPNAAGLVTCIDIPHAERVAEYLRKVTGEPVTLVHSDDAESSALIDRFRDGTDRWIVSVRMVSEGVDIPRIQVLVYATTILSRLFFIQFAGRALRGSGTAVMFIPGDEVLIQYAREIAILRDHQIDDEVAGPGGERDGDGPQQTSIFVVTGTRPTEHQVITTLDGVLVEKRFVTEAQANNPHVSQATVELIALNLQRQWREMNGAADSLSSSVRTKPDQSHYEALQAADSLVEQLSRRLAGKLAKDGGLDVEQRRVLNRLVNGQIVRRTGKKKSDCSLAELHERVDLLKALIRDFDAAKAIGRANAWAVAFLAGREVEVHEYLG